MQIDHLGIAVRSLAEALPRFEGLLKTRGSPPEEVAGQKVRVSFLEAGTSHLELLEPVAADSAVGRFLEKRGEGIHHVAFEVPDVDAALQELIDGGQRVVDAVGRSGARGRRVGFAHPSAFDGVLVEFVERR